MRFAFSCRSVLFPVFLPGTPPFLVSEEAEDTKASVEAFVKLYKKAVEDGVKEAVKGRTPKNGAGGSTITKEQILQIKDPGKRQQMIAEHMDLFR